MHLCYIWSFLSFLFFLLLIYSAVCLSIFYDSLIPCQLLPSCGQYSLLVLVSSISEFLLPFLTLVGTYLYLVLFLLTSFSVPNDFLRLDKMASSNYSFPDHLLLFFTFPSVSNFLLLVLFLLNVYVLCPTDFSFAWSYVS